MELGDVASAPLRRNGDEKLQNEPWQVRLCVVSHKRHIRIPNGELTVRGGFAAITREVARKFGPVTLCVPVEEGHENGEACEYPGNLRVASLPSYSSRLAFVLQLPAILLKITREVRRSDLVYAMCPNDVGVLAVTVARVVQKPVFVSIDTDRARGIYSRKYGPVRRFVKSFVVEQLLYRYLRWLCRTTPVFVTGDLFLGKGRYWSSWVKTTVRTSELPAWREPQRMLSELSIVFAGRLAAEKNVQLLLRAVSLLETRGYQIRTRIIGTGPLRDELLEYVKKSGLRDVTFVGEIARKELLASRFHNADVLVLPSTEERQGKVLLEAMACSIPVVASDVGGIGTVVEHNHNGLLFVSGSVEGLVEHVARLIDEPDLRMRLAWNGHRYAQNHTLDAGVDRLVRVVREWASDLGLKTAGPQT